jgi:gliding motility-associated-like protein
MNHYNVFIFFLLYASSLFSRNILNTSLSNSSVLFEENCGQIKYPDDMPATEVKYVFKQGNLKIFLLKTGLAYQLEKLETDSNSLPEIHPDSYRDSGSFLQTYRMDMELVGANPHAEIIAKGKSADYTNYYQPDLIQTHSYQKVIYKNIYPGIDWVIYSTPPSPNGEGKGGVKYDFIVHPGADPALIRLKYKNAEQIYLDQFGNLILRNRLGDIRENAPEVFQNQKKLTANYLLRDSIVSFQIKNYNKAENLIIDPKLEWSTYYGGSGIENAYGTLIDSNGDSYLYGSTTSSTGIAYNGFQNNYNFNLTIYKFNGLLVKFNSQGNRIWSTYYGTGLYFDCATIDFKQNLVLAGETRINNPSIAFNGHQSAHAGQADGFIVKFDSSGSRLWATYYGGSGNENISDIEVDSGNAVIFCGSTNSNHNIAINGYRDSFYNKTDASAQILGNTFLVKLNSSGVRQWGTYYGLGYGSGGNIIVDSNDQIYLSNLNNPVDTSYLFTSNYSINTPGPLLMYLAKFRSNGTRIYGKPIGQNFAFNGGAMKIHKNDSSLYLISAYSGVSNLQPILSTGFKMTVSADDLIIIKMDKYGNTRWESYCGGNFNESKPTMAFDKRNNIYIGGTTTSTTGIYHKGLDSILSGSNELFVTKVSHLGTVIWSSYFGGNTFEEYPDLQIDKMNNLYISGYTASNSGISYLGHQNNHNGGTFDAFLMKISCNRYDTIRDTICRGDSLYYRNKYVAQAGLYTDSLLTWDICDSFITLHLAVLRKDTTYLYDTICSGTSYVWNGANRTTSGIFRDTLINNVGCDSFLVLNLLVKRTDTIQVYDTSCANLPKTFNGQNLTLAGVYRDTFMNAVGCDSHIFYHFIPKPIYETPLSRAICANDSTLFGDKYYKLAGVYYDTLKTIRNCDSVLKLTLTINLLDTNRQTQSICRGKSYNFYSQILTNAGTYSHKWTNRNGCDSTILLTLSVIDSSTYSFNRMLCSGQSFPFNNQNLTQAGVYRDTFMNYLGCDSFVTLNLSFGLVLYDTLRQTVCAGQAFRGYSSPGTYYETYKSNQGCDSILTIYLKHLPPTEYKTIQHSKCGAFRYGSSTYTQNDSFTETIKNYLNCDSIVTKHIVTITKPNPIVLEPKSIPFCEEILHRNQAKTQSFYTQDTVKSAEFPYCDSLYQPIFYQREVRPDLAIYAASDTVVRGQAIQLSAALANNYRWNTGEQTTVIRPKIEESAIFTVRGWNLENCESQASISISAIEPLIIDFPTAFSPNGDGLNDSFYPNTNQSIFIESFDIYNRIGEKVYSYTPQSPSWNGFYLGQSAAKGVYSYILNYRFLGNRITKTGEVMVVR